MSDKTMRDNVKTKARECFGWASGLGGFEDAVDELFDYTVALVQSQQAQGEAVSSDELAEAMQTVWNDVCDDTGCVPSDFEIRGPKTTRVFADFIGGSFASFVMMSMGKVYRHPPAPAAVPEGLVSAVKAMLENDGRDGTYSAIRFYDARELVKHYIYAAPTPAEPDSEE